MRCFNVLEFRHADPALIDRLEAAVHANRLYDEFIPQPDPRIVIEQIEKELDPSRAYESEHIRDPRMYQGSYSDADAEFLVWWWRSMHWGVGRDTFEGKVERTDSDVLKTEFCTELLAPTRLLDRLTQLGFRVQGEMRSEAALYAWVYENGVCRKNLKVETREQLEAGEYLADCARRGIAPSVDEAGVPDQDAVASYVDMKRYLKDCEELGETPILGADGRPDASAMTAFYDALSEGEPPMDDLSGELNTRLWLCGM
jgi:hypothetical protein